MVAVAGLDELHETGQATCAPLEFLRIAEKDIVVPTGPTRRADAGATSIVFKSTTSTGTSVDSFSKLAVTTQCPALLDWSLPEVSTVATASLEEDHLRLPDGTGRPFLSTRRPVRRWV